MNKIIFLLLIICTSCSESSPKESSNQEFNEQSTPNLVNNKKVLSSKIEVSGDEEFGYIVRASIKDSIVYFIYSDLKSDTISMIQQAERSISDLN